MNTEELTKKMMKTIQDMMNKQACGLGPFQGYGFEQALEEELFEDDEFFGIADYDPGLTYSLTLLN
jgi:hypothetical protein